MYHYDKFDDFYNLKLGIAKFAQKLRKLKKAFPLVNLIKHDNKFNMDSNLEINDLSDAKNRFEKIFISYSVTSRLIKIYCKVLN